MQERLREHQSPPPQASEPPAGSGQLEAARARADRLHRDAMTAIEEVLSVDSRSFNAANTQPGGQ